MKQDGGCALTVGRGRRRKIGQRGQIPASARSGEKRGLIVWDKETHIVARLRARHVLATAAELRDNAQWQHQGCIVGEPAWRLSPGKPNGKGETVLANQIVLDPEQTALLLDLLTEEEGALKQMADEEEAEERRVLAQIYERLIQIGERGKHTIYDENLSWEENKRVMRRRWESGEFPKELTWTEERLYADVMEEINAEHEREEQKRQERGRRAFTYSPAAAGCRLERTYRERDKTNH